MSKQTYLKTLFSPDGTTVTPTDKAWHTGNEKEWENVRDRVLNLVKDKDSLFIKIALAISKYHYYGGPCDWEPSYDMEGTVKGWAEWIYKRNEEYEEEIEEICRDYDEGKIPDAFDFMMSYFD